MVVYTTELWSKESGETEEGRLREAGAAAAPTGESAAEGMTPNN